ncbi:DUF2892 domain-containing protein [Phaeocystidibacter luteus]|uniref:DUF2892 domain-containing protein n=1 Tax=Phaeocystidibacter luteus TaxID=911197 RepID=A0A6N6RK81_9FLAO|nr:DUF2892 domain-containing protein [Phaeocystidibacter luteus]KAB2814361.1 DUF2892 domain-containing protein [Phaeocystidibacter luteus]
MLSKVIRLVLTAALFAYAVYEFIEGHIGNGIMLTLLAGLVLFTYFRHERMLLALWYMRKQDMEKAQKQVDSIKTPEQSLTKGQQAYWYYLKGLMEAQTNMNKSESYLRKALSKGLRMDQDKALVKLQLAGIAMSRRRKREAQTLLTEAKKLDKRGMLDDQIKMFKQQMKRI